MFEFVAITISYSWLCKVLLPSTVRVRVWIYHAIFLKKVNEDTSVYVKHQDNLIVKIILILDVSAVKKMLTLKFLKKQRSAMSFKML